jgi:hypothetical protein
MAGKLEVRAGLPIWFRWIPMGFLLASGLLPISYIVILIIYGGLEFYIWELFLFIPLLIALFAWKMPIAGGMTAVVVIHLGVFLSGLISFWMTNYDSLFEGVLAALLFLLPEYLLMFVGGILSIIWGVRQWRWKRNQARMNA